MLDECPILCLGGLHYDRLAQCLAPYRDRASNPVRMSRSPGGVAHNIACDLVQLGTPAAIMSLVGKDPEGHAIIASIKKRGIDSALVYQDANSATGSYLAVLDETGDLATGLSDMACYKGLTPAYLAGQKAGLQRFPIWIADANLSAESLAWLAANKETARLYAAPVSPSKTIRWKRELSKVDMLIGNQQEISLLADISVVTPQDALCALRALRHAGPEIAIATLGACGAVISSPGLEAHFPIPPTRLVDANGAGDAFFAGFCHAHVKENSLITCMSEGLAAASLTAETSGAVRPDLTLEKIRVRVDSLPAFHPLI